MVPGSVPVNGGLQTPTIWKISLPMRKGFAEDGGIVLEAARPVVVGNDGDGMSAGSGVVIGSEETAEGRLEAEGGEHVAGDDS